MAVKFPLKMADGAMVRTLEELREHFDMTSVLAYYEDGRLKRWLENGYYDNEAAQVDAIDALSENLNKELCRILRLDCIQSAAMQQADLGDAKKKNKRIESLKKITADDRILSAVDRVAFTQEELDDLVDHHVSEIYLCGECFMIPECETDITYIGVNNPIVQYDGKTMSAGIDFQNLRFDLDSYIGDFVDGQREGEAFFTLFEKNLPLGIKLLCVTPNSDSAKIQTFLGVCYEHGRGIDTNAVEAVRWYRKAAEQGYAAAQNIMGNVYNNGYSVQRDFAEAVKWYRKAAEQELPDAQHNLALKYWCGEGVGQNYEEAVEWYKKAAEQGHAGAQYDFGKCYYNGNGIVRDYKKTVEWYKKAAEQGHAGAQYDLGKCYYNGNGIVQDYKEAVEWYKKAAEQGNADAQYDLGQCYKYGQGVDKNALEAFKWYSEASKQGNLLATAESLEMLTLLDSSCATAIEDTFQRIGEAVNIPWWKMIF